MAGINIIVSAIDNASRVLEGVGTTSTTLAQNIERNWKKITLVTAAVGVAIEAMARKQGDLTEQTRKVAASLNMEEKEVRSMVLALSDVSTPIEEVLALMELGRQQGLKATQQLGQYVKFWDMVSDATGEAADALADAGISLHAVGIAAGEEGQALAAFGYIAQETTASISEFLHFLALAGPELRVMGADINDAAAILGILEHEFGLAGRRGIAEFRQAVNESGGDLDRMLSLLGISRDMFNEYSLAVENSSEVIARNAEIHEGSFTILQKLQSWAADLVYKYGDLITVISVLTPLLIAIGPIIKGVAIAKHLWALAMEHVAIAAGAADLALAPFLLTIGMIGAAIVSLGLFIYGLVDAINKVKAGFLEIKELLYLLIPFAGTSIYFARRAMGLGENEAEFGGGGVLPKTGATGYYQYGGTIPGTIGKSRLAIVHGGEDITPYRGEPSSKTTVPYTIQNIFQIAEFIVREEADIDRVAERLLVLQKQSLAGVGVR